MPGVGERDVELHRVVRVEVRLTSPPCPLIRQSLRCEDSAHCILTLMGGNIATWREVEVQLSLR